MGKVVTFGEVLMCLASPGSVRLKQSKSLDIDFGGAEANVAVSLAQFGEDVSFVTRVPKNDMAELALMSLKSFGVNTHNVQWGGDRLGLYYFENGAVYRGSKVIYDRDHSAMATIEPHTVNWDEVFKDADWFHWTGITPALSASAFNVTKEALKAAKERGITISGDYNFRKNLWNWGVEAEEVMPELMNYCDIMSGIHPDVDVVKEKVSDALYAEAGQQMMDKYPNCKLVVFTSRGSVSASHNTWAGALYDGERVYRSITYNLTHIVDRVGGGDSFMAALIYALRNYETKQEAVDFATAASTLKHFVLGDQNICSVEEVEALMGGDRTGLISR
ncbi:sugar kinase [Persicobacter psychrovividus]|uniref:2-dehydro-3-deoxygluconokinase n=1 Tax=Persicobacter psychrovividus TaxID=387638 RepID=A0ABN6LCN5_9BACT|nr:2-dehydro-3-deoxygluconokinase [Persicobacter psychrovividus]